MTTTTRQPKATTNTGVAVNNSQDVFAVTDPKTEPLTMNTGRTAQSVSQYNTIQYSVLINHIKSERTDDNLVFTCSQSLAYPGPEKF